MGDCPSHYEIPGTCVVQVPITELCDIRNPTVTRKAVGASTTMVSVLNGQARVGASFYITFE